MTSFNEKLRSAEQQAGGDADLARPAQNRERGQAGGRGRHKSNHGGRRARNFSLTWFGVFSIYCSSTLFFHTCLTFYEFQNT